MQNHIPVIRNMTYDGQIFDETRKPATLEPTTPPVARILPVRKTKPKPIVPEEPVASNERLMNGSFELSGFSNETYPEGWFVSHPRYTRSKDDATNGTYSLRLYSNESPPPVVQKVNVVTNAVYTLSGSIKLTAGSSGNVFIDTWDDFDATAEFVCRTEDAGDWKHFTATFTNTTLEELYIRCFTESFSGICYFDNISLIQLSGEQSNSKKQDPLRPYTGPSVKGVDTKTMQNKVVTGYQGWFNCEGDGANLGWTHWADNRNERFGPGNITVDLWPDLTEYDQTDLYETGFRYKTGVRAKTFSSFSKKTTQLHFEWMRDYGIDGAFIQRFSNGLSNEDMRHHKNVVLANAREAANRTGRSYAVMYDLSGTPEDKIVAVFDDWRMLREKMHIGKDPAYQHHKGKPLVVIWGVGFNNDSKDRPGLEVSKQLIQKFKDDRCSVMLGIPTGWRELRSDSMTDPKLHDVLKMADILSPWSIGRIKSLEKVQDHADTYWGPDIEWAKRKRIDYLPVIYPGFSWYNLHGGTIGAIPRLKGQFLWAQIIAAKKAECDMLYIAMFDEVDEGTAIFKCSNEPPTANGGKFLTLEGLPSDHYLWIAGQAGRILRGELKPTEILPDRETSPSK